MSSTLGRSGRTLRHNARENLTLLHQVREGKRSEVESQSIAESWMHFLHRMKKLSGPGPGFLHHLQVEHGSQLILAES